MDTGLAVLHIVVGLLFVGHGAQKLFGVFGGHGLEGTAGFFELLGLRPGRLQHPWRASTSSRAARCSRSGYSYPSQPR